MAAASDKVILNFAWEGPNRCRGGSSAGGLDIWVVDLAFAGAKTAISVAIPENINPAIARKFPFTCRHMLGQTGIVQRETHPDLLRVTVEQVRSLTLKAGVFEKGRPIGPITLDPLTGRRSQQETLRRTDRSVELKLPEKLEIGQTYKLVVTSEDLSLSARLIKEE